MSDLQPITSEEVTGQAEAMQRWREREAARQAEQDALCHEYKAQLSAHLTEHEPTMRPLDWLALLTVARRLQSEHVERREAKRVSITSRPGCRPPQRRHLLHRMLAGEPL
ncbi:MAG: hypothetical protein KDI44_14325 [Thiothrix sp.]|nr:hypothetical protein [Thiothrix sp.]HPQ96250.1 hypothetical protein [Thiolinea sp.]